MINAFLLPLGVIFAWLVLSAVLARVAYAVSPRVAQVPLLDVFVSFFLWVPWVAGGVCFGWWGLLASVVAQFLFLHAFCFVDRLVRGGRGRTLTQAQARLLGPVRNQLGLLVTTPAVAVFLLIRLAEILLYPFLVWLARLPAYRHSEWINLSRHRYAGLVGSDLVWCWYCDWMTGVWSLGGEMLRNVESFWCPIRFRSPEKNRNIAVDFPDVARWAPPDASLDDAIKLFEEHYDGSGQNAWWGHPSRKHKP
jgi:hypothetical protein